MLGLKFLSALLAAGSASVQQPDAAEILAQCNQTLAKASTVSGVFYIASDSGPLEKVDFKLAKPNQLSLISARKQDIFDGKDHYIVYPSKKQFEKRDPRISGMPYLVGFEAFPEVNDGKTTWAGLPQYGSTKMVTFEGLPAAEATYTDGVETVTLFVDAETKLPRGWNWSNGKSRSLVRFKNIVLDKTFAGDTFAYSPSNDFTEVASSDTRTMAAIGTNVADAEDDRGTKLSRFSKGKKATVLAFFNTKYESSAEMIRPFEKMSKQNKDVAFVMASVGLNEAELKKTQSIFRDVRLPMLNAGLKRDGMASRFGVTAYPAIFVIDSKGIIVHRQLGYAQEPLQKAIDSAN